MNGGNQRKKIRQRSCMTTRWQLEPGKSFADTVAPMENQIICQPSPHLGICTCTVLALNILHVCSELWNI